MKGHGGQVFMLMMIGCCILLSFFLVLPLLLLPFLHVMRIVSYLHLSAEETIACRVDMRT